MVKQISKFLEFYQNIKTPRDLYHTEIRIIDNDYDVELNGILINRISHRNNYLIFTMMNNRKIKLNITDNTRFLINGGEL